MNAQVPETELLGAIELLRFIADLCVAQPEELNVALCRFTHTYHPATQLLAEVIEIGDRLAQTLGFADLSLQAAP